jgi:hypothetical protein
MTEALFEAEEGVATAPEGFFTGVRTALVEDDRVWSTTPAAVKNGPEVSRGLGWKDFALRFRTADGTFTSESWVLGRRKVLFGCVASVLNLRALRLARLAEAFVGAKAPELIDFRAPREAVFPADG